MNAASGEAMSSRAWIKWTALGCGGFLLLGALVVTVLVTVIRSATSGPVETVRSFLDAAAAGDYAGAHDHFSAPLKQVQSLEAFSAGVQSNPLLFDVVDTTFNQRNVDQSGAQLGGTLTLRAGTEVPASFKLVRENDSWKLIAYQIGDD